jgi:hypothetical protein
MRTRVIAWLTALPVNIVPPWHNQRSRQGLECYQDSFSNIQNNECIFPNRLISVSNEISVQNSEQSPETLAMVQNRFSELKGKAGLTQLQISR